MIEDKKVLSEIVIDEILSAARREAVDRGLNVSIAIVDDSGVLSRFIRMNAVHVGTVDVAIAKARSAALFRRAGKEFGEELANGALVLTTLPNLLPVDGGEPVFASGFALGGIGVSGSSPSNDGAVARAGLSILKSAGEPE